MHIYNNKYHSSTKFTASEIIEEHFFSDRNTYKQTFLYETFQKHFLVIHFRDLAALNS